jgi:hypothetical protein
MEMLVLFLLPLQLRLLLLMMMLLLLLLTAVVLLLVRVVKLRAVVSLPRCFHSTQGPRLAGLLLVA